MQVPVGHGWMSGFIVEGVVAGQTGWPRAVPSGPVAGVPWPGESNAQGQGGGNWNLSILLCVADPGASVWRVLEGPGPRAGEGHQEFSLVEEAGPAHP